MELDSNAHSVSLMSYHLVLVVKYRRKVFDDKMSNRAKEILEYISPKYHITLQEWNHDKGSCTYSFQGTSKYRNKQIHQCLQKCNQSLIKERISRNTSKITERAFWEPKLLPAYNRWRTDRSHPKIYRKSG